MPASAPDKDVFDQGLQYLLNNSDEAVVLSGEPSSWSDVDTIPSNGGLRLGAFGVSGSIMSLQDDGSGGRELKVIEQGFVAVDSDTANHIALVDTAAQVIRAYTEYDDGNGNPISVTVDLAYNAGPTTFTLSDFTAT